jgi:Flp pilus assembly protein TadG
MGKVHDSELGQVLILLSVGIITLLGFTALAIDGGRLYEERRHIQGVADTSSLTGALYIAHQKGPITTSVLDAARNSALFRAQANGYGPSITTVTITKSGSYYNVKTVINSAIDPVIAQIVYRGQLKVGANAVARVYKSNGFADGQALYAMSRTQKNALEFTGNADIVINGTGIFSNSNHGTNSIAFGGSSVTYIEDLVRAVGGINLGGDVLNPDGSPFADFVTPVDHADSPYVPTPDCDLLPEGQRTSSGGEVNFTPGVYNGITENGHNTYNFAPGFYCINGAFTTNNGVFNGEDVSFYVSTGNVSLAGTVTFTASNNGLILGDQNWDGMLLHVATGRLTINGNADSDYIGSVYVPTPANPSCKLNGGSDSEGFSMQLMCDSININGNGTLVINYDQTNVYVPPVPIDLVE